MCHGCVEGMGTGIRRQREYDICSYVCSHVEGVHVIAMAGKAKLEGSHQSSSVSVEIRYCMYCICAHV